MTASTPENDRPPPTPVSRSGPPAALGVLSSPLADRFERARIGIPTGDHETIPIVIELNPGHPDGLDGAYAALAAIWSQTLPGPAPEPFDEDLRVLLTMTQVRSLVHTDQARPGRVRSIQRVWPDFPVDLLDAIIEPDR